VTFASGGHDYVALVTSVTDSTVDVVVPSVDPSLAASGTRFAVSIKNAGTSTTTIENAFTMVRPALADVNGGLAGSGTVNSLFIVDGASFGDPLALTTTLPATFSVQFSDTTTVGTGNVHAASIPTGGWTDAYVLGNVPSALTQGQTYYVTVTTPSGTSTPRPFQVTAAPSFSASTINWTEATSLPAAVQGLSAVVAPVTDPSGVTTSYIFALGGNDSSLAADDLTANVSSVTVQALLPTATTGNNPFAWAAWEKSTPLPHARSFAAAVVANSGNSLVPGNGNIYVLGGLDPTGAATSTVYYAPLGVGGTLGAWAKTTSLPRALYAHGAVLFHGRIYIAGGNGSDGNPVGDVYSAKVRSDGTLAVWEALPSLPTPLAYHQFITAAAFVYAVGGQTSAQDPLSATLGTNVTASIEVAELDFRDGSFVTGAGTTATAWTNAGTMTPKAREKHIAVTAGSNVFVTGGLYNGDSTGSSEAGYCTINTDGTVGTFSNSTTSSSIKNQSGEVPYNHAAAFYTDATGAGHVLVLGGGDVATGVPHAQVWYQH
jgi:hypothetical protein